MYDSWAQASDFEPGEEVYRPYGLVTSPITGQVVAVHPGINQVDVQWPTGMMRMDPWDIVSSVTHQIAMSISEKLRPVVEAAKVSSETPIALRRKLYASFPQVSRAQVDLVVSAIRKEAAPTVTLIDDKVFKQQQKRDPKRGPFVFDMEPEKKNGPNKDYVTIDEETYDKAKKLVDQRAQGEKSKKVQLITDGEPMRQEMQRTGL